MAEAIAIDGLSQFVRNLKALDRETPKALRLAFNAAADVVVQDARAGIPTRSGKAKGSVKARSTQTASRIVGGGNRAPYYPWLDFGGRVGRNHSIKRPFLAEGRYIYRAYFDNRAKYVELLEAALIDAASRVGIEVD
ncbi:HK97 gp10 family phage protein [Kribbella speibonae]|uniref:HK97 gp10 family phage protein n=1 Tax=Kribbella speibonae TaxID=1572660 RepID=A0ABY2AAJ1_9ACTN|nr:HK97 gp10 family phage protein [Kribbella speibonae]TCC26723.1 HK97 gp10 family phage protein [Kribbella speibonae]